MSKEGGQGDTAAENTGAQTGDSNAQDTPVTDNAASQNAKTDASGGPEVLKTDAPNDDRVARITAHLNASNIDQKGDVADDDSLDEFKPHILHSKHDPVPIAMVNRRPKGSEFHFSFVFLGSDN